MKVWEELVSAALVGTERRPFPLERLREVAGEGVPDIAEAEGQVLAAAAVVDGYRRAGRVPERRRAGQALAVAPPHDRPPSSATAAQLLALLLSGMVGVAGGSDALLQTWLVACAAARQRPPDGMLARLLDLGTASPRLRPAIVAAVGARGAWLGSLNPQWAWAVGAGEAKADYATATTAERVALLADLHGRDRAVARELLASTWASEPAADRLALLNALASGLDEDDEPFLEETLDDRAGSVRAAAAELLDRLPGSRRAARMADRARALVRAEGRFRRHLVLQLPEALDASARRDGITDAREKGTGLHAAWLVRIVASTPLEAWEPHLGLPPTEAVAKAATDAPELVAAWERAALAQRNERWAFALLRHHPSPALVGVLSPPAARRYAEEALRGSNPPEARFFDALAVPGPWDAALSKLAVERSRAAPSASLPRISGALAARLDPSVLPVVEEWIEDTADERALRDVRALAHALSIRATIAQEFS